MLVSGMTVDWEAAAFALYGAGPTSGLDRAGLITIVVVAVIAVVAFVWIFRELGRRD